MRTEYASASDGLSPYESLAKRSGKPVAHIVQLASENRLGELFDEHGFVGRPQSPAEALRRIEKRRHDPSVRRRSPSALIGELRAQKAIWQAVEDDLRRRSRDPYQALAEIYAKQIPDWRGA